MHLKILDAGTRSMLRTHKH